MFKSGLWLQTDGQFSDSEGSRADGLLAGSPVDEAAIPLRRRQLG